MIESFMKLFAGLERAHGTYQVREQKESGKNVGQALTVHRPVTAELWRDHLDGKQGIGVVPIRDDNSVMFGAIDVDGKDGYYKDFDAVELARRVEALGLPLNPCLTKSGGLHLYLFAAEPVPAGSMIDRLKEMAELLGFPVRVDQLSDGQRLIETFPKQRQILRSRGDEGSWINMPYFGATRPGLGPEGAALSAADFILQAENRRQSAEFFAAPIKNRASDSKLFPDGPPCLQRLEHLKISEGARSNGLVNIITYLKKANPDGWRSKAREYNQIMIDPPLEDAEDVIRSGTKRNYHYLCGKEPIQSVCDSKVCRGRKFGVGRKGPNLQEENSEEDGEAPPSFPPLGQLRKLLTEPPLWFLDVGDQSVELSTDDLQNPRGFQKRAMEVSNCMIPMPTATSWQRMVQDLMTRLVMIEAPADSSPSGMFWEFLEKFCTRTPARARDEILNGRPWTEDGKTWFMLLHLMTFLEKNRFKELPPRKITALMKQAGVETRQFKIRGKNVSVWGVDEFSKLEAKEERKMDEVVF